MKPKTHVYQFALRRPDNKQKQFIIESDMVYSEEKLSEEVIKEMAEKHKCDIRLTYLGVLQPPKVEEVIDVAYHTKEMIETTLLNWKEQEREAFLNGQSS